MNMKQRRWQKTLWSIGVGLALTLLLALGGFMIQHVFGLGIGTIMDRFAQPVTVSQEKMLADWNDLRERAKQQPAKEQ